MPARLAPQYYLHIASGAWQWRIEAAASVEIRHAITHAVVATLTPAQIVLMASHYLSQARLVGELLEDPRQGWPNRRPLASAPARAPLRAMGVPLRPVQEARRAARAARKPSRRMS